MFFLQLVLVVEAGTLKVGVGTGTTTSGGVETLVVAGVMDGTSSEIRVVEVQFPVAMESLTSGLIRTEVEGAGAKLELPGTQLLLLKAF